MKLIRILFILAIDLTLAACSNKATIIIENVSDNPELIIRYTVPTRYANPMVLMDTLSGTSELRFRVVVRQPYFVSVQQIPDFKGMVTFPVSRGETYRLQFDGESFSFPAPGQEVQRFYASIPDYGHTQLEARNYAQITDLSQARESLDSTMKSQMAPFDSLLQIKKISPRMYDLISSDRECNTLAVWGQVGVLRRDNTIRDAIFETTDLDNDRLAESPKYYGLMEDYANWRIVKNMDKLRPRIQAGERYTLMMETYREALTGGRLEAVCAWQWRYAAIQKQYEKELISLFEVFEQEFVVVVVAAAGIAGGVHARRAVERVHADARIVGKRRHIQSLGKLGCFDNGVFLEGIAVLDRLDSLPAALGRRDDFNIQRFENTGEFL